MMEKEKTALLVVFLRGQLNAEDKERMTEAGIIAVEADDPQSVCQLQLTMPLLTSKLSADALLTAALTALASAPSIEPGYSDRISQAGKAKGEFVRLLAEAVSHDL